jgi:hypothetical protein
VYMAVGALIQSSPPFTLRYTFASTLPYSKWMLGVRRR